MKNEQTFQKDDTRIKGLREALEKASLLKSFGEATRIFSIALKHRDQFAHEMGRLLMEVAFNYMYEWGSESFRTFFQEDNSYLLRILPNDCNENGNGVLNTEEAVKVLERYLNAADPESWSLVEKDFEFDWPAAVIRPTEFSVPIQ